MDVWQNQLLEHLAARNISRRYIAIKHSVRSRDLGSTAGFEPHQQLRDGKT